MFKGGRCAGLAHRSGSRHELVRAGLGRGPWRLSWERTANNHAPASINWEGKPVQKKLPYFGTFPVAPWRAVRFWWGRSFPRLLPWGHCEKKVFRAHARAFQSNPDCFLLASEPVFTFCRWLCLSELRQPALKAFVAL